MKLTNGGRIAAGVAAAIVALYVLASLSYVAPDGAFKSATAGLAAAGRPYFSQTWNVFAPNIMKANIELQITAQWRDAEGALQRGEWFSATDIELQAAAGQPVPSRIVKQTWNLIRAYNTRFQALNPEQRDVVRDTFIRVDDGGYVSRTTESLTEQLDELGDNHADVVSLLRYDDLLKEYATYLASAYYGHEVERVRWRLFSERPNSFEQRLSAEPEFEPQIRAFGWRQVTDRIDPAILAVYEDVVRRGARR